MNNILSALNHISCADLTHDEWIRVGMALKAEGFDISIWDEWSSHDAARYHPGECQRRWNSFHGSGSPVTGATIVKMAQDRGWSPFTGADGIMDWNDVIEYDGDSQPDPVPVRKPTEDLILYLETLFEPEDHVGYVTNDAWKNEEGKWVPAKGVYDRTAGELIASLHRYPDDIGATVGDWKPEAGAWIRFNALDGEGVRNENVTGFRFALVESDSMPIDEQIAIYRRQELPIAALVSSAGKSVHAIVRVDAQDAQEYRRRVTFLYDFLAARGLKVDTQNRNPSRLSRMPGVTRNGQLQKLLGVNIGRKSWVDWMDFVEGATDELPALSTLADYAADPPALPEELISGVLRRGHKMLISGSSKAGKSFLLMELCIALAEGRPWLGFPCKKGRVLYVNLEIDPASCVNRFVKIYDALGYARDHIDDIIIWNLRGHAVPLDKLVPKLIRRVRDQRLDAIIIDPIYKVITGDENSASDMAAFCNQFDRICNETGCSTIYCHHHSKLSSVRAQISTEADSIRSEVQATYSLASDMTQVTQQVSTLSEQTQSNYTWAVTRINQLQQDLTSAHEATEDELAIFRTYMSFDEQGLVIGKTGNPFTFRVVNDRLAFYMNDTEVAYLSNNKLYVTQAEILTKLIIGRFAFEPQANGNLSLIYNG